MSDLVIEKVDEVNIRVRCERSFAKELSDFFTFKVPGHKFMPAYRNKVWDGTIKLYNMFSQEIHSGLLDYVTTFAKERGYTCQVTFDTPHNKVNDDLVKRYLTDTLKISAGGKLIIPHDHQIRAISHAIKHERCLLLSPTGSGKSLIIYGLLRHLLEKTNKKILIIVPTTGLVSQMYSDFEDYSKMNEWNVEENCHKIYAGQDKKTDKTIVISTWQSLYKLQAKYFEDFEVVFGDECHLFKAKSLTSIMSKLKNAKYRIGTTGTLDGALTHKLVIEGLFGPVKDVTTTKELMEKDILSKLEIDCILLDYGDEDKKLVKTLKYPDEMKWLISNHKRNKFISKLTGTTKGNTLVLFQFVENHGKQLYETIKLDNQHKNVFLIHGGIETDDRERVRGLAEKQKDAVIVASYGTFSTGINIKNLHNIIFASPSKSRIRILQSIGRQLRKHESKRIAKLFDIGDNLQWKKKMNHTLRHFFERIKLYKIEDFVFKTIKIKL